MKITLNHSKLAQALNYMSKAVSQKPNIPILSNVLINVDNSHVKLSATNLDMGIHMWIPGQVESEGKTTVSAKYLADFVSASTADKVDMFMKDNQVHIQTESSKASFSTIAAEEFPVLPTIGEKPIFTINAQEFVQTMSKVLFACSTDLSVGRIQQSGSLFEIKRETSEIDFIGLDGFRLSKRTVKVTNLADEISKSEIIVSARYLNELIKIISDNPAVENLDVFLSQSNSQIIFKFSDIEFSVRLLEGPYPEYKRILPDSAVYKFEASKKELENALKITNSFARGNLGNKALFDFDIETSRVILKSTVADIGEGETEIHVSNIDGEADLNTAFTTRYLQDFVNHVSGDTVIYETKGALAASVFRDKDDENFLHIIMPMRREN